MSTLGLVAVILAAVVVALFVTLAVVTRRRHADDAKGEQPRTVADLVRLRAEAAEHSRGAAASPAPAVARAAADPVDEPAPAPEPERVPPSEQPTARVATAVVSAAARKAPPAAAEPVVEPAVRPAAPTPAPDASRRAESSRLGDTPWARAARVAAGESAFWAPDGESAESEEAAQPSPPVWTPPSRGVPTRTAPTRTAPTRTVPTRTLPAPAAQVPAPDVPAPQVPAPQVTAAPTPPPATPPPAPAVHDAVWTAPEAVVSPAATPAEAPGPPAVRQELPAPRPLVVVPPTAEPAPEVADDQPVAAEPVAAASPGPVEALQQAPEAAAPRPLSVVPPPVAAPPVERPVPPRPLAVVPPLPAEPAGEEASDGPDPEGPGSSEDTVGVSSPAPEPLRFGLPHPGGGQPEAAHPGTPLTPPVPPRPQAVQPATPPPLGPVDVVAPPPPALADGPVLAGVRAGRPRRSAAETAAEQAAADLALLRTFGFGETGDPSEDEPLVALAAVEEPRPEDTIDGAAQPVRVQVVGRDGKGIGDAAIALLDDRGRETATGVADATGCGTLRAPHPGSYVIVSTAPDHQPGAVAITVDAQPSDAEILLARSAALTGTIYGEDGPIAGAALTLVQDGEIVDSVASGPDGVYRISDLAAGEYGLSVTAEDCEPVAVLIDVPDETELQHDVDLEPAGIPSGPLTDGADDLVIGHH